MTDNSKDSDASEGGSGEPSASDLAESSSLEVGTHDTAKGTFTGDSDSDGSDESDS